MEFATIITPKREALLEPLIDWKILGVRELFLLSEYEGSYRGILKAVQRLEKAGLIESFTHKMNNRKFFYLNKKTYQELTGDSKYFNDEIRMHDAIVSTIVFKLIQLEKVSGYNVNILNSDEYNGVSKLGQVEPDATIDIFDQSKISKIAIEVELNRKSSENIMKKYRAYHEQDKIDYAIYFFSNNFHLRAYTEYYKQFMELNNLSDVDTKVYFVLSPSLANFNSDILSYILKSSNGVCSKLTRLIQ